MSKRIPVLVVEDNRLVRDGIIAMLAEQQDLKVVGAVDRAPAALERAREMKPELVLVDAALGDHDSHRLVAQIKDAARSEEHTSELQSRLHLVCRLLLEKKKTE